MCDGGSGVPLYGHEANKLLKYLHPLTSHIVNPQSQTGAQAELVNKLPGHEEIWKQKQAEN